MQKDNANASTSTVTGTKGKLWRKLLLYGVPPIAILVSLPFYVRANARPCLNACINNLRQIDGAKEQFALESKLAPGDPVTSAQISGYFKSGIVPTCPGDGIITIGPIDTLPTCSSPEGHNILPAQN